MHAKQHEKRAGNYEDVEREKPAQGRAADHRPAQQPVHDLRPQQRHSSRHRGTDCQAPVGIRVPAQHLAGEEHSQRAQKQADACHPRQLARVLVGPVQEDLRHVNQDHDDHAGPRVVVQGPQKPAERMVVVQIQQAFVGLVRGGHEDERQTDTREDLDDEECQRSAAEDVPPAERPSQLLRNGMLHQGNKAVAHAQPRVEPSS